jgi:hypothetical protein
LLSDHFVPLVQFYITIASNKNYDESTRIMALSFLMWCTIYKKNKLQKLKLVGPFIGSILPIGAESSDIEEDDDSPSKVAFQVISSLSTNLPPVCVFPEVMKYVCNFMQEALPSYRKAAMLALSVLVDGCADYMRTKLEELLPILMAGLNDGDESVRVASCIALGSISGISL